MKIYIYGNSYVIFCKKLRKIRNFETRIKISRVVCRICCSSFLDDPPSYVSVLITRFRRTRSRMIRIIITSITPRRSGYFRGPI